MENKHCLCGTRRTKKIIFGLLIVLSGVLLLAFNFQILPVTYKYFIFSWPMLIIAIGVINLFSRYNYVSGIILIIVGGYFFLYNFFPKYYDTLFLYWPLLLVVIGIVIIFRNKIFNFKRHIQDKTTSDSYIEEVNILGGSKTVFNAQFFKGGKIVNVFGGSQIDLTQTNLEEGKTMLEMVCVFGGVELIIPSDWVVHIETVSVLGGFTDKRINVNATSYPIKELYISGVVIFGGCEIKNGI